MDPIDSTLYKDYLNEVAEVLEVGKAPARLTREQFALVANVKPETTDVWASTGRHGIPYSKLGRRRIYRIGDVIKFLISAQSITFAA